MSRWRSIWEAEQDEADDRDETAPDEEELEGEWELDPNDPSHPDFDLSEAAGYADWEPPPPPPLLRRGLLLFLTLLILAGMIIPLIIRLTY